MKTWNKILLVGAFLFWFPVIEPVLTPLLYHASAIVRAQVEEWKAGRF